MRPSRNNRYTFLFINPPGSTPESTSFPLLGNLLIPSATREVSSFAILRSDKFVWTRLISTPCSSVAKPNPWSADKVPVAISVRLPDRTSRDGWSVNRRRWDWTLLGRDSSCRGDDATRDTLDVGATTPYSGLWRKKADKSWLGSIFCNSWKVSRSPAL